ncbi:MAG TPA: hypothetical protein VF148_13035, partial [Acidimicrobiia bacterium]
MLPPDRVLVTIGTPCSVSAVGSTETFLAKAVAAPDFIAYAAFDAGIVDLETDRNGSIRARWAGTSDEATSEEIERRHGEAVRAGLGIRQIGELSAQGEAVVSDIAASLPHDMAEGGLRRLAGLGYDEVRGSDLRNMHGLFDDDPRLGPSLQSQL